MNANSYGIESTADGVLIHVRVTPRSSSNKIVGVHNGALKVVLTAPPVEGAANKALLAFLAKVLGVPKSAVELLSGQTSRNKVIAVSGVNREDALRRLVPSREQGHE